jgi:hypothetical protein
MTSIPEFYASDADFPPRSDWPYRIWANVHPPTKTVEVVVGGEKLDEECTCTLSLPDAQRLYRWLGKAIQFLEE